MSNYYDGEVYSEDFGLTALFAENSTTVTDNMPTGKENNPTTIDEANNHCYWHCTACRALLERKVLNCSSCLRFFKNGVFMVHKVGNVCQDCLLENGWKGERQKIYDIILENLAAVSCSNATNGCQELFLPEDLGKHIKNCQFREINCVSQGCAWRGKLDELTGHFEDEHEKDVLKGVTFNFNVDIAEDSFVVSKLLIKPKFKYLIVIERKRGARKIRYQLYGVDEVESRRASVGLIFANQHFNKDIATKSLNMLDKNCAATEVDLKALNVGKNSSCLIVVQIPVNKTEQVLQVLECPSCLETMKPPIYLCIRGHSVCSTCSSKSSLCLKCKGIINKQLRNDSLETLTADLSYSCINQSSGCKEIILGCDIGKHESKCIYTTYACPLELCTFKSDQDEFKQHVKNKHVDVLHGNEHFFRFKLGSNFNRIVHMCVNGCIFSVQYSYNVSNAYLTYSVSSLTKNPLLNHTCNIAIRSAVDQREMRFIHSFREDETTVLCNVYKTYNFDQFLPKLTDLIFCVKIYKSNVM